jgi:hypothetical protein
MDLKLENLRGDADLTIWWYREIPERRKERLMS